MTKTVKFSDLYTTTVPMYALITKALSACEREFDVDIMMATETIHHKRRDDEYVGKEIPASAEYIRKAMAEFCASQCPYVEFNFWRFSAEINETDAAKEIWEGMLQYI